MVGVRPDPEPPASNTEPPPLAVAAATSSGNTTCGVSSALQASPLNPGVHQEPVGGEGHRRGRSQPGSSQRTGQQQQQRVQAPREERLGSAGGVQQVPGACASNCGVPQVRSLPQQLGVQPLDSQTSASPKNAAASSGAPHRLPRKFRTEATLGTKRTASASSEDLNVVPQRFSAGHSPPLPLQNAISGGSAAARLTGPGQRSQAGAARNLDNALAVSQVQQSLQSFLSNSTASAHHEVGGVPSVSMRALKLSLLIDPFSAHSHSSSTLSVRPSASPAPLSPPMRAGSAAGGSGSLAPTQPPSPKPATLMRLSRCMDQLRKTPSLPGGALASMVPERVSSGTSARRLVTGPMCPRSASFSRPTSSLAPGAHTRSQRRLQLHLEPGSVEVRTSRHSREDRKSVV